MIYKLYEELPQKQTETEKKKNEPLVYLLTRVDDVESKPQADAWVNKDSLRRSWTELGIDES